MTLDGILRRLRGQEGLSLVEVLVVIGMLMVVLVMFLTVLHSLNNGVLVQQERSIANDQARLAIERLDREVRSANRMYNPGAETLANSFRVYTQTNYPTRQENRCVQWKIEDGQLLRRSWPTSPQPGQVTAWHVEAEKLVNEETGDPAFVMPDPSAARTVDVTFVVDADPGDSMSRPVRLQTSLTGRNTSYGYPSDVCTPVPA